MNTTTIRNVLEWISAPLFAFIAVHMAGHGTFLLLGDDHDHGHGAEEAAEGALHFLEGVLSPEMLVGVLLLILFVWLWHRPALQKLVPCGHTNCQHTSFWPHILATVAFVVHFFPEADLRLEMMEETNTVLNIAGIIAFASHFIIDIIVGIMISLYWPKTHQKVISFVLLCGVWFLAFLTAHSGIELFHESGILTLLGAFFLSMFVHVPNHKK